MVEPSHPSGAGESLWRLPSRAVLAVLTVEVVAVGLVAAATVPPGLGELALAAFLTLLSLVHTELATGVERARRRDAQTSYFDLSSVWTFAAAVLLPPALSAAVIVVVYSHLWWRVWQPAGVPLHRHVYTTATVVLAALAAHGVVRGAGGVPTEAGDLAGVAGIGRRCCSTSRSTPCWSRWPSRSATTGWGRAGPGPGSWSAAGTTTRWRWPRSAWVRWPPSCWARAPGLVALVLPPILVLHRAVQVRQLEEEPAPTPRPGCSTRPPGAAGPPSRAHPAARQRSSRRADPRPRPLQDGQRPLRAPRRRRGAGRGGRRAAGGVAGPGSGRPVRRRGVRRPAARSGPRRGRVGGAHRSPSGSASGSRR